MSRFFVLWGLILFSFNVSAKVETYYAFETISKFMDEDVYGEELAELVYTSSHKNFDSLGYKSGAKNFLFGVVDLEQDGAGYFVKDVYCNKIVRRNVGPKRIPNNNQMNTEHTWPQSKGSRREPFRSDLHHLFPTDSKANSVRGNVIFAEVIGKEAYFGCDASQKGYAVHPETGNATRKRAYQPPPEHRGNVARALFYASIFYNYEISDLQEYYLKKWHEDDPVDENERERNDQIEAAQGNRNPFIDYANLAYKILDF